MRFTKLQKKDYEKAAEYAVKGMHFNWYMQSPFLLHGYGRYFLYSKMNTASQIIAAYDEQDHLQGLLLAEIYGEKRASWSFGKAVYVFLVDLLQRLLAGRSVGAYDKACADMKKEYLRRNSPDGEIVFLAADPSSAGKGVGTALLKELIRREPSRTIFLYTDNGCTYQFYEHRGFSRKEEREILFKSVEGRDVPLDCYLYSQTLPAE